MFQEMPKISPEEFAAILAKQSNLAEYDVVTNMLQQIPVDCDPDLVDQLVKENQGMQEFIKLREEGSGKRLGRGRREEGENSRRGGGEGEVVIEVR